VRAGEVVALIGGNGAGKTTTLRAISGLLPLRRGRIEFEGERIDGRASAQVVARGIAHVPEGRQLFPSMSVRENLELGARDRAAPTSSRTGASCSTARARRCSRARTSSRRTSGSDTLGAVSATKSRTPPETPGLFVRLRAQLSLSRTQAIFGIIAACLSIGGS